MPLAFCELKKKQQLAIIKKNLPHMNPEDILEKASCFSEWRAECCGIWNEWPYFDATFNLFEWEKYRPRGLEWDDLFLCIEAIHGKELADIQRRRYYSLEFDSDVRTKIMKFLKVELARNKDWDRETVCDMQCEAMNFEGGLIARLDIKKTEFIEIKADIVIVQEFDDDIEAEVSLDVYYNLMFRNLKSPYIFWQEVISVKVGGICVDELLPYESGIDIFKRKLAMVKELHLCKKCNQNVNTYFLDIDGLCEDCYMVEP